MTQRDVVLDLLYLADVASDLDGVTTGDFLENNIPRFSARIEELRRAGYKISSERLREGSWIYRLDGWAEAQPENRDSSPAPGGGEDDGPSRDAALFDEPAKRRKSTMYDPWEN